MHKIYFMGFVDVMSKQCLILKGQNDPEGVTSEYESLLSITDQVHHVVLKNNGYFPMLVEGTWFSIQ
jgi:hypothetical protein